MALSRTPLVAVFHQDDVMRPGHLARHVEAFRRPEPIGFVCSAVEILDDQDKPVPPSVVERPDLGPSDHLFPPGAFVAELVASNPVRCSAVTLRKEAHADVGGFDPAFRYAVDWEFWQRIARRWAVCWLTRPTVGVRWHPGSETHRFRRGTEDIEEVDRVIATILTRDGAAIPDVGHKRRESRRRLSLAYLNRAYIALRGGDTTLARRCLGRSVQLWKGVLATIARDPKLALMSVTLAIAPGTAGRWMAERASDGSDSV